MTRRALLAGLVAFPAMAIAHEDHGAADVIADAEVLAVTENLLTLRLAIFNRGPHALTVFSVIAPGATAVEALFVPIEGNGKAEVEVALSFDAPIPGILTAILDFGAEGQGPVLVMP